MCTIPQASLKYGIIDVHSNPSRSISEEASNAGSDIYLDNSALSRKTFDVDE